MVVAVDGTPEPDEGPDRRRTRSLRPVTVVCVGCLLLGAATAVIAEVTLPDARSVRGLLIWSTGGVVTGLVFLFPIALVEAFRETLARRLRPYSLCIERYVSLAMMLALGYLIASTVHAAADWITLLAFLLVGLGAWTKVGLSIVFRES
jgi:hypothetical protein